MTRCEHVRIDDFGDRVVQCQQWNASGVREHGSLVGKFTRVEFGFDGEACHELITADKSPVELPP